VKCDQRLVAVPQAERLQPGIDQAFVSRAMELVAPLAL